VAQLPLGPGPPALQPRSRAAYEPVKFELLDERGAPETHCRQVPVVADLLRSAAASGALTPCHLTFDLIAAKDSSATITTGTVRRT
jgi:hypothetical protein